MSEYKPILDSFIGRLLSRKLIVFVIASIALFRTNLDSSDWVIIAGIYLAVEGGADIVERLFKSRL
jgi:hypothetical protein